MNGCGTPLDQRIDKDLLVLNQRATNMLPRFFEGVRMEQVGGVPVRFGEVWLAYLAAEMYGNADTALIAIVHNRGRQARILERQMYEMMVKAQYYTQHEKDARLEYLAMPFRDLEEPWRYRNWDRDLLYAEIRNIKLLYSGGHSAHPPIRTLDSSIPMVSAGLVPRPFHPEDR